MTPDLPTATGDWRLVGRTARLVLGVPRYALLAVVAALVGLTLFVYTLNVGLINALVLGGSLPVENRLGILVNLYPVVSPTAYTAAETGILLAVAALIGVNVALVAYHLVEHATLRGGTGSAAGVVLGTLGAGCAACGSTVLAGLLSLFGATGLLTLLPLDGLEFALLSLGVLLLSLYWLADGMRGGMIRGCPVDP
ncbi:hypothetical protein [Halostella salina]|uniref:hypothetical protein n=1 Tax=Halostella salina TaxID=1547897 RepID=UPI000EF7B80B|nr:hypothetical protein [Halostella salina]